MAWCNMVAMEPTEGGWQVMEITIPLGELLVIAEVPLREYLKNWQNDTGNPLEFDGNLDTCKIGAVGCINCEISLEGKE